MEYRLRTPLKSERKNTLFPTIFGARSKRAESSDSTGKWGFTEGRTRVSVIVKREIDRSKGNLVYQSFRESLLTLDILSSIDRERLKCRRGAHTSLVN